MKFQSLPSLSRRDFLSSAALMTAGFASAPLLAQVPVVRTGKPFFKLALAAYSFNKLMGRNWPTPTEKSSPFDLAKFIDFSAEQNLDAVELTSYYFPNPLTEQYINEIKEQTFRLGLDISGTAISNDFCLPAGAAREATLNHCREWIDYAALMGAPVIRIFAGNVPEGDSEDAAIERCVQGIEQSLEYAAKKGVCLALENHHGITSTADQLLKIIQQVQPSPWFGINFDSGNFRTADPYADLEKIAPYTINAQIKVVTRPDGKEKVPTDFAKVISILKQASYRGYIVLEYEEPEDPFVEIPKFLDVLRTHIS